MFRYIQLVFLSFFLVICSVNSQERHLQKFETLKAEIVRISNKYKSELFFNKSVQYFSRKEWDSTLLYTQKQILTGSNEDVKNFCHFLRGYSFDKKGVFKEAEKEYSFISEKFELSNLVEIYLGLLALEQSQFRKAISHYEKLLKIPDYEFRFVKKIVIIHNLGLCYLHLKEFDKSESYLRNSIKLYEKEKDTIELIGCYGDIATLYYEQYKDDLAIPYFKKAYNLSKKLKVSERNGVDYQLNDKKRIIYKHKRIASKNMSVVEGNRKNFEKALVYRKEMEIWVDSLNDQNKIYEVAKLEKEFAVQQKQKEVDLLQVKNELQKTQKNIFLYSAVGLLILLGGSLYFYREKVKSNRIITQQKETLDELNATKDKLFSIVSHDLRSSVNALKNSNVTLQENLENKRLENLKSLLQNNTAIVNSAYSLLDNLLNWALLQTNNGYFKITPLRLFFITEQVAFNYKAILTGKNIKFDLNISKKEVVLADQESLKIVLRNLIDNALKFTEKGGSISVYTQENHQGYCDLVVEDTGLGMSEETRLKLLEDTVLLHKKEHEDVIGTGLGLQLCKSMIKKNNGKFYIESELGKGTKMVVSLPRNNDLM